MAMEITSANFDEIVASDKPFMVDFWAGWCGPCRMIAPLVEEFADEYEGRTVIGKCDVDAQRELASKCSIRSIPALLFFKGGELVDKQVGALGRSELKSRLEALL